jgi:hypothetical protein
LRHFRSRRHPALGAAREHERNQQQASPFSRKKQFVRNLDRFRGRSFSTTCLGNIPVRKCPRATIIVIDCAHVLVDESEDCDVTSS